MTKPDFRIKYNPHAEVAELADALGSGLSGRKVVRVQVPPSAQTRGDAGFCFKMTVSSQDLILRWSNLPNRKGEGKIES